MKRCFAYILSLLLLLMSVPPVSAAGDYNDDQLHWGDGVCTHSHVVQVAAVESTCISRGHAAYTMCDDCGAVVEGSKEPLPFGGHAYDSAVTVEPTCIAEGVRTYTCRLCGDAYREAISANGHQYDAVVTAPDCENGGYTTYTCTACGDSYVADRVDALGHNYVPLSAVPPTCTEDGFERFYCTNCNDSYTVEIKAEGHTYDAVVTAPDCENGGYTTYTCSACGDSYVADRVDALGHNYVPLSAVPPTCTEDGFERFYCTSCNDSYTVEIKAEGHQYEAVVTAPDCENGGYTTYTCSVCGDSYVADAVDALGHNYVPLSAVPPTCTEDGFERFYCTNCNDSYTVEIKAEGHQYDAVVTAPDCENGGYTTYTCSVCGDSYVADRVDALGHNYVPLSAVPPTCTEDGFERFYCTNCNDSYTVEIKAEGHQYDAVVTAPDCENGGYTTYTCTACGDSYVADEVDALGHAAEAILGKEPTCTETGLTEGSKCSVCGKILVAQEEIPAKTHDYQTVVTAPTCAEQGYTTYTCSACGDSYVADYVPATGEHSYDNDRDADCNLCGAVRDVTVPGDVNRDERVNNRDLGMLQQHLNDWEVSIDLDAADVNNDNRVNNRDLGRLQQYLNDWDVTLI